MCEKWLKIKYLFKPYFGKKKYILKKKQMRVNGNVALVAVFIYTLMIYKSFYTFLTT